jgi:hypothetical protein
LLALKNLLKGGMIIVIAHKLSTVKSANRIVVLKDGVIEQVGALTKLSYKQGI